MQNGAGDAHLTARGVLIQTLEEDQEESPVFFSNGILNRQLQETNLFYV